MTEKVNDNRNSSQSPSMMRSVLANWIGHFLLIVSGFILPRVIHVNLGQEKLGVWDFGWSVISYFGLINAGLASSVNRYVARYRAKNDFDAMNRVTSSCALIFFVTSVLGVAATLILSWALPKFLPADYSAYLDQAYYLILFLGLATSLGLFMTVYNGVFSGCQRYDMLNLIETSMHLLLLTLMTIFLFQGYGLTTLALFVFIAKFIEAAWKYVWAHKACPELAISFSKVDKENLKEVIHFGSKTFMGQVSKMILYQGHSLLVGFFLGPAVLAVHARAMALILHANKVMFQFARVLIPTASSLQAIDDREKLKNLFVDTGKIAWLLTFPIVLVLGIFGNSLMTVWMGDEYAQWPLITIMAVGHMMTMSQVTSYNALLGMNKHGYVSLITLCLSCTGLLATFLYLKFIDNNVVAIAVSISVTQTIINTLVVPGYLTKQIGMTVSTYMYKTMGQAFIPVVPFALWLITSRWIIQTSHTQSLFIVLPVGGLILAGTYWVTVFPDSVKQKIFRKLFKQAASSHA